MEGFAKPYCHPEFIEGSLITRFNWSFEILRGLRM